MRNRFLAAAVLAAATGLTACGGGSAPTQAPPTPAAPTAPPVQQAQPGSSAPAFPGQAQAPSANAPVGPQEGFTVKPTGLQVKDLTVGTGTEAASGDTVKVHYTGWLFNGGTQGDKFDSSVDRGDPFSFELGAGRVIKGWDEGVAGMKVGGKRTLVIPPDLAYGARQAGATITPNSTLKFDVELLDVVKPAPPEAIDTTGMTKTASGLMWQTTQAGTGTEAKLGQKVEVHYTGWLYQNGMRTKKFDSSADRGQPLPFSVGMGQVIPGWEEGVTGMKVGEKRRLLIPPDLAYGDRQAGPITPNSTLYFEIELMTVSGDPMPPPEPVDTSKMTATASGLKYEVTHAGTGTEATDGKMVSVHYTGYLFEDGKRTRKFDSSLDRNQPLPFKLGEGRVIKGWEEGIKGMKVGEKRKLLIPSGLAYGERAMGPIKANSTLFFEVELMDVQDAPAQAAPQTGP